MLSSRLDYMSECFLLIILIKSLRKENIFAKKKCYLKLSQESLVTHIYFIMFLYF